MRDSSLLSLEAKKHANYPGGHPEGYPDGLKNFMSSFYGFIAEGGNPRKEDPGFPTFEAGHAEIALVEAVLESHRKKTWVEVIY